MGASKQPIPPTVKNFHNSTPTQKKITIVVNININAVPKSGCIIISAMGNKAIKAGATKLLTLCICPSVEAWKYLAKNKTMLIFISSEGWILKIFKSIQRWAPMPMCPKISTAISSAKTAK